MTVSRHLAEFLVAGMDGGVPHEVLHEGKRLLLNQLKASIGATTHPAIQRLHGWATTSAGGTGAAHVHWLGTATTPQAAALVNGAFYEVLDFHDTYIPCFMHAVSAVLPAVFALAEVRRSSGRDFLTALVLGIEAELAVATCLMPTGYYRGYVPAGLTGAVGAAAACAALGRLDVEATQAALGIAMCTSFGLYESVGSNTLAYITGATARSGLSAFELAERGFTAPNSAFEGEKGMFVAHCDEDPQKIGKVLAAMANPWRLFGQTYKVVPTETITHGPVECVLALRPLAQGRSVDRMIFKVNDLVQKIADERRQRFGKPSSESEACFDLRHCAAAAWLRERFTTAETARECYTDPEVLALRNRVELVADPERATFEGCSLEVRYADGTRAFHNVDHFRGTPGARVPDQMLAELLAEYARGVLPEGRAAQIADAIWQLDAAPDLTGLVSLLRID